QAARQVEDACDGLRRRDTDDADAAPRLSPAQPRPQEARLARFPRDRGEARRGLGLTQAAASAGRRRAAPSRTAKAATAAGRARMKAAPGAAGAMAANARAPQLPATQAQLVDTAARSPARGPARRRAITIRKMAPGTSATPAQKMRPAGRSSSRARKLEP